MVQMKTSNMIGIIMLVSVAFVIFAINNPRITANATNIPTKASGVYDEFAKCLYSKGAVMYGTDWCSHCKKQKELFEDSFEYINFVDCDDNKQECLDANVIGYPTWVIDNQNYAGKRSLKELSTLSDCDLDK